MILETIRSMCHPSCRSLHGTSKYKSCNHHWQRAFYINQIWCMKIRTRHSSWYFKMFQPQLILWLHQSNPTVNHLACKLKHTGQWHKIISPVETQNYFTVFTKLFHLVKLKIISGGHCWVELGWILLLIGMENRDNHRWDSSKCSKIFLFYNTFVILMSL